MRFAYADPPYLGQRRWMWCSFKEVGTRCHEEPVYRIEMSPCPECQSRGVLFCWGHWACPDHTAGIRADRYIRTQCGSDLVASRISGLT